MDLSLQVNEEKKSIPISERIQVPNSSKCMKFDPVWVQVLINLRTKYSKMFTRRRNSASEGWKLVFQELKETGAPEYVTITKIKKKWMNLMTRYRQIKNTTLNPETITWPYFKEMDHAFGRVIEIEEESKMDTTLNQTISNDERQNFIKRLIELRYKHRHLFTGRKYTARDGWIIIQSLMQCQGKYSIDQLSKCWQNLVQRYKQLMKGETENVTWPYFDCMHKWFNENNKLPDNLEIDYTPDPTEISVIEGEGKDEMAEEKRAFSNISLAQKNSISIESIKIQLLTELKATQEKCHEEVMEALNDIRNSLNDKVVSIVVNENSSS